MDAPIFLKWPWTCKTDNTQDKDIFSGHNRSMFKVKHFQSFLITRYDLERNNAFFLDNDLEFAKMTLG